MTQSEREALEYWQSAIGGKAERRIRDLNDVVDDLTTFAQTREGVRAIRENRSALIDPVKKLADLLIECKPLETVS